MAAAAKNVATTRGCVYGLAMIPNRYKDMDGEFKME